MDAKHEERLVVALESIAQSLKCFETLVEEQYEDGDLSDIVSSLKALRACTESRTGSGEKAFLIEQR